MSPSEMNHRIEQGNLTNKPRGKYKYGKQKEAQSFQEISARVSRVKKKLSAEQLGFFWLLYYTGVRKSEAYERVAEDVQITPELFIIDFHQRKKRGETVPPLELPRSFPGIEILVELTLKALKRKAVRKQLQYQESPQHMATKIVKAKWIFPRLNRSWAAVTIKKILGKEYYPHYLRLNRITELCCDPQISLARLKSYTGIKSLDALQSYLGVSQREQKASIDFMAKQIKPNKQKNNRR